MHVLDERAHRMIHLVTHRVHAGHVFRAVVVCVIIPAAIAHCHKAASRLAHTTGHEHLQAQQVAGAFHVVITLQLFLVEQRPRVVARDGLGIFLRPVKRIGHAAGNGVERLLLVFIRTLQQARGIHIAAQSVETAQQSLAISQPFRCHLQAHVRINLPATGRVKGRVTCAEITGLRQRGQGTGFKITPQLQLRINSLGQHQRVARHSGVRMIGTGHPRVERAHRGLQRIARHGHRMVGVPTIL